MPPKATRRVKDTWNRLGPNPQFVIKPSQAQSGSPKCQQPQMIKQEKILVVIYHVSDFLHDNSLLVRKESYQFHFTSKWGNKHLNQQNHLCSSEIWGRL